MQTRMNWSFWKGSSKEGVGWSAAEPEPEGSKRPKHAGHRVRERTPPWLEVSRLVGSFFSCHSGRKSQETQAVGAGKEEGGRFLSGEGGRKPRSERTTGHAVSLLATGFIQLFW